MNSGVFLSTLSVVVILVGVALLTTATTFILERRDLPGRRGVVVFFVCLLTIWVLASIVAFVFSPSWWPNETL